MDKFEEKLNELAEMGDDDKERSLEKLKVNAYVLAQLIMNVQKKLMN